MQWLKGGVLRIVKLLFGGFRPRFFRRFRSSWDHFLKRFGIFLGGVAPLGNLSAPLGPAGTENNKISEEVIPNGSSFGFFLDAVGTLGLNKGLPWSHNGGQSGSKLRFVDFVEMGVFPG